MKQKTKNPLVSVIMPVYNARDFLALAIESILNQTFQDFEFIIVDDASTDSSWQIISRYQKKFPNKITAVRLEKNRNNGGDSCANEAYKRAKGNFIARMDADDVSLPYRLEKQLAYMRKNPDVILLGTQAFVIDHDGAITGEKREPVQDAIIRQDYFMYHPIIHPSVMIRRSLLPKRDKLYQIVYSANNDLLTFFELLKYGKFANLSEKLLHYRIHGKNDSLTNPKERFMNTLKIRWYAWRTLNIKPTAKAIGINLVQIAAVVLLPSSLITRLYMVWKGLSNKQQKQLASVAPSYA